MVVVVVLVLLGILPLEVPEPVALLPVLVGHEPVSVPPPYPPLNLKKI